MMYFLETPLATIEEQFVEFTKRKDIAIILINQHVSFLSFLVSFSFISNPFVS